MAKPLLQEDDVRYLLSEKLSQDPLEEHFARQRRISGCDENPKLAQRTCMKCGKVRFNWYKEGQSYDNH